MTEDKITKLEVTLDIILGVVNTRLDKIEVKLEQIITNQQNRDLETAQLKTEVKSILWIGGLISAATIGYVLTSLLKLI